MQNCPERQLQNCLERQMQSCPKRQWYVIQVRTGTEEHIRAQCQIMIANTQVMEACFIPYYEEKKKYEGRWHIEKKILFPGYIFMISQDVTALYLELKKVFGLTRILGSGDTLIPLTDKEIAFMERFGGPKQVVEMSLGIIEGSQVIITEGPLQGLEGCIKKIDRHKRKAWVELPMFGRIQRVEVGVEIVRKMG